MNEEAELGLAALPICDCVYVVVHGRDYLRQARGQEAKDILEEKTRKVSAWKKSGGDGGEGCYGSYVRAGNGSPRRAFLVSFPFPRSPPPITRLAILSATLF